MSVGPASYPWRVALPQSSRPFHRPRIFCAPPFALSRPFRCAVLEKRLLPAVEHGRVEPVLIAQVRHSHPVKQMPTCHSGHVPFGTPYLTLDFGSLS